MLVVAGPTGCGKLTAAQQCVAHAGFGLVEIVNQSVASTQIISTIKRSGNMLVAAGESKASVIVVSGTDGIQSGYADLVACSRVCGKHVVILLNNATAFSAARATELHRCSWDRPWSVDALRDTIDAVHGSDLLTMQEKGMMVRQCTDIRQLKTATEMLVMAKKLGCEDEAGLRAAVDHPVHRWYDAFEIIKGTRLPTAQHDVHWIAGSYLGGLPSASLDAAAEFASNLTLVDTLQPSDSFNSDPFSTLVLQSAMPPVSHQSGLKIKRLSLESLPRPNKRARYSATLGI